MVPVRLGFALLFALLPSVANTEVVAIAQVNRNRYTQQLDVHPGSALSTLHVLVASSRVEAANVKFHPMRSSLGISRGAASWHHSDCG